MEAGFKRFAVTLLAATLLTSAAGAWWDSSWDYRKELTVSEDSGSSLTQYPVATEAVGIGDASWKSIRLVDNSGSKLSFGLKEWNASYYNVTFQPSVSASSSETYYIYYNNSVATPDNSTWNTVRWNVHESFEEYSQNTDLDGVDGYRNDNAGNGYTSPYVEASSFGSAPDGSNVIGTDQDTDWHGEPWHNEKILSNWSDSNMGVYMDGYVAALSYSNADQPHLNIQSAGGGPSLGLEVDDYSGNFKLYGWNQSKTTGTPSTDTWYYVRMFDTPSGDAKVKIREKGSSSWLHTLTDTTSLNGDIGRFSGNFQNGGHADLIRIRKYVSQEPSLSFSSEQTEGPFQVNLTWTDQSSNEDGFKIYSNASGWSKIGEVSANKEKFEHSSNSLNSGMYVCFNVTAYNQYGESSPVNSCETL